MRQQMGGQTTQSTGDSASQYYDDQVYAYVTGDLYDTTTSYSTSTTYNTTTNTTTVAASSSNVKRLSGSSRYDTMAAAVKSAFSSSDWAIVASGEGFADALAASALAGAHNCPVILTSPGSLSSQAKDLITSLGVSHVQIVGGTAAVSSAVESELASLGVSIERIAGADRFETSLKVLDAVKAAGSTSASVIIATGANYADALSMGSWAWSTKSPIVLVPQAGSLSSAALSKISQAGFTKAVIVGGTSAVSSNVESALAGLNVTRLGGADRYETSRTIAQWTTTNGLSWNSPVFACGQNYPDALVASAVAGKLAAPVLLADATNTSAVSLA
jgi:putative cell wall-binding protein